MQRKFAAVAIGSLLAMSTLALGGTSVTISGSGFALGAGTEFKFGRVLASGVSCSSSSSCTATAPAAAKAGAVEVIAAVGKAESKKCRRATALRTASDRGSVRSAAVAVASPFDG
jgi:hypothetical protein